MLELVLEFQDLAVKVGALLEDHACSHHWPLDAASPAEGSLAFNKTVGDVFILALGGQSHHHLKWVAIGSQDHHFYFAFGDGLEQLVDSLSNLP